MLAVMSESLGERARRLRKERGLTQNKLAFRAQVDPSTISRLELGNRTPDTATLRQIADALDVPIKELLGSEVDGEGTVYRSLRDFLAEQADANEEESAWLLSQRFSPALGDIGSALWWYSQLRAYRMLRRGMPDDPPPERAPETRRGTAARRS